MSFIKQVIDDLNTPQFNGVSFADYQRQERVRKFLTQAIDGRPNLNESQFAGISDVHRMRLRSGKDAFQMDASSTWKTGESLKFSLNTRDDGAHTSTKEQLTVPILIHAVGFSHNDALNPADRALITNYAKLKVYMDNSPYKPDIFDLVGGFFSWSSQPSQKLIDGYTAGTTSGTSVESVLRRAPGIEGLLYFLDKPLFVGPGEIGLAEWLVDSTDTTTGTISVKPVILCDIGVK
ncbi:MAG: hypothetical protein L6Q71_10895 [Planctomycetes bacterium]|nr:hypothetical protein [Planctomycetota bacterium]NUQ33360.1 hypothetical protein [Planctomycetaceae bacterium]